MIKSVLQNGGSLQTGFAIVQERKKHQMLSSAEQQKINLVSQWQLGEFIRG